MVTDGTTNRALQAQQIQEDILYPPTEEELQQRREEEERVRAASNP